MILILLSGCTLDEPSLPSLNKQPEFVSASEDPDLSKGLGLITSKFGNARLDLNFDHLTSQKALVVRQGEVVSYSYALFKSEEILRNLVITEKDGNYLAGIFTYTRSSSSSSWKAFEGTLSIESLDGTKIVQLAQPSSNTRTDALYCSYTIWHIGYMNGEGEFVETYTEIDIDECYYISEFRVNDFSVEDEYGGYSGDLDGGGGNVGINESTPTCGEGETWNGTECLSEEDMWEQSNLCIKENFENNECLMKVWNAIINTNAGHELLSGFLKTNPEAKICFDFQDIGTELNGNAAYPRADGIINITINNNQERMGRSQLEFARTILHEMIHAELIRMVVQAEGYSQLQQFASTYQGDDPFMMIWEYYDTYGLYDPQLDSVGWQHEYMADYYIEFIANGLKDLHPILSSHRFIDYKDGSFIGNTSQIWDWDDFFIALAWKGLQETDEYQESVVKNGLKYTFDWYWQEANAESSINKCH